MIKIIIMHNGGKKQERGEKRNISFPINLCKDFYDMRLIYFFFFVYLFIFLFVVCLIVVVIVIGLSFSFFFLRCCCYYF